MKKRPQKYPPSDYHVAYHEAGHVVSYYKLVKKWSRDEDDGIEFVTITDDWDFAQVVVNNTPPEQTKELLLRVPELTPSIRDQVENNVIRFLSGYAAEARYRKIPRTSCCAIVAKAIREDEPKLEGLLWGDAINALEALEIFEPDEGKRQAWFLTLWGRAWKLAGIWRKEIEQVAILLLKHRTVKREMLDPIFIGVSDTMKKKPLKPGKEG